MSGELHRSRWIDIDGVVNMRDLGGLPTADGGRIAWRRLIRSDNLQDLSPAAVDHLVATIGLRDVIDLRSETELHLLGDGPLRELTALTHHHHSLLPPRAFAAVPTPEGTAGTGTGTAGTGTAGTGTGTAGTGTAGTGARTARERDTGLGSPWKAFDGRRDAGFWATHYLGYLTERPDSISAALDVISRSEGATIVHCAAGKDRTGTVVAMALSTAGVPDEVIVEDYVLTAERITAILDRLNAHPVYGDALRTQPVDDQRPRAESMAAILAALREGFGGAEGWLREHGWGTDDLARLRSRLRER